MYLITVQYELRDGGPTRYNASAAGDDLQTLRDP